MVQGHPHCPPPMEDTWPGRYGSQLRLWASGHTLIPNGADSQPKRIRISCWKNGGATKRRLQHHRSGVYANVPIFINTNTMGTASPSTGTLATRHKNPKGPLHVTSNLYSAKCHSLDLLNEYPNVKLCKPQDGHILQMLDEPKPNVKLRKGMEKSQCPDYG